MTDALRKAVRSARRLGKNYDLTWRYMLNFRPTTSYIMNRRPVEGEAARVLADLNRDGIALTTVEALLGSQSIYASVVAETERRLAESAEQMEAGRAAAEIQNGAVQKPFMYFLLGQHPPVERENIYAKFALQEPITAIVNAYLGMYCSLCAYNVWYNYVTKGPATQSQLWHRDPEDRYILKVFMCLSDIDEGGGPFTYATGTHPKGSAQQPPPYLHKDGMTTRSDDSQMATVVPADRWVRGIARKGTLIFADTRGYHKGGLVRSNDRTLYIAEFLSQAGGRGLSTNPDMNDSRGNH